MKNRIISSLIVFGLLFIFNACKEETNKESKDIVKEAIQKPEKNESEVEIEETEEIKLPKDFKSQLRPNQKIEIKKIYTDTVNYLGHNDDGDYWTFLAKKGKNTISLVHNNDSVRTFVKGDKLIINWKADRIIHAGDEELLDFSEFLVSFKKISAFKLKDKKVKALWRENVYDATIKTEVNTIILNKEYIKNISEPEKAALGYVATFIGNECEWDGKANEDRSNLKCKILTSLDLGYQCSDRHKFFLRQWFAKDSKSLKSLEECMTMPNTATIQTTFDEVTITTKEKDQTIQIIYKVIGSNMREGSSWGYTQTDKFQYNSGNITLIDSQKIENEPSSNSNNKKNDSFVISCGSGCAMRYTQNKVVKNDTSHKIIFKVEMYVNEVINDEYFQTYVFNCDTSHKAMQISLQDNPDFSMENQVPDMQENLTRYTRQLCDR